jgi:restriction system protein
MHIPYRKKHRKKRSIIGFLLRAPWWAGIMVAACLWFFIWIFLPALHTASWLPMGFFIILSAGSAIRAWSRARLLRNVQDIDSVRKITWQNFERLIGEVYRRLGYRIEETGQGGADGGIDLVIRKHGKTMLVQCKQWRHEQVGVSIAREMYGLMIHHHADGVKIVCIGYFTNDAIEFSRDKPIELINGNTLLDLVHSIQKEDSARLLKPHATVVEEMNVVDCPKCGGPMKKRQASESRIFFWGCASYPLCRGTRSLH